MKPSFLKEIGKNFKKPLYQIISTVLKYEILDITKDTSHYMEISHVYIRDNLTGNNGTVP